MITFLNTGESEPVTFGDGVTIRVGGAEVPRTILNERDIPWVAAPHESCTGAAWMVNRVTVSP